MTQSEVDLCVAAVLRAAKSGTTKNVDVFVSDPVERMKAFVVTVASGAPLDIARICAQMPGAQVYTRPGSTDGSVDVYFHPRTAYGKVQHNVGFIYLILAWVLAGVSYVHRERQ
jgi:hypothetical protein